MDDRTFWREVRRALLTFIGAIEKRYEIEPRDCPRCREAQHG